MVIIGLTGPTGAGKGVFARVAAKEFHALHIDTDKLAREVVKPGKPCLAALVDRFGKDILLPDGSLNRKTLAGIVFSDKEKLAFLNAVTHPAITEEVERQLALARQEDLPYAVIDAPLLFESGENRICNVTVGVLADEKTRLARILARDGIDREAAEKRLASAKDAAYFKKNCDIILQNDSSAAEFEKEIRSFFAALQKENMAVRTSEANA